MAADISGVMPFGPIVSKSVATVDALVEARWLLLTHSSAPGVRWLRLTLLSKPGGYG